MTTADSLAEGNQDGAELDMIGVKTAHVPQEEPEPRLPTAVSQSVPLKGPQVKTEPPSKLPMGHLLLLGGYGYHPEATPLVPASPHLYPWDHNALIKPTWCPLGWLVDVAA